MADDSRPGESALAKSLDAIPGQPSPSLTPSPTPSPRPSKAERTSSRTRMTKSGSPSRPIYMAGSSPHMVLVRRRKRKEQSAWKQLARWLVENQIGLSFNLLALLFLAHLCIPKAQVHTRKFFTLAYYNAASGKYAGGWDDYYFIVFNIVLLTGLRASTMEYLLAPLGRWAGLSRRKEVTRFSEQGWMLVYYVIFWPLGLYLYAKSKYFMDMQELWTDWPDRELTGIFKGYVLVQWAFWLQQIMVIHIEERRKDHWQMLSHHVVTIGLLWASYSYHFTRIGNLILVLMDVGDLFLSIAKCFKYCGFTTFCDVLFGVFMASWIFARHGVYNVALWSVYRDSNTHIPDFCFTGSNADLVGPTPTPSGLGYLIEPFLNPTGMVCFNKTVKWLFLVPLLFLQVLLMVWFTMIVRVAIKVIKGDGAEDTRSDDECDEEEDEDEFVYEEARPLEEEVGVEDIDLKGWERRAGVRRHPQASASGVSLPGHSDRKELLGRIGCEKQVD